MSDSFVEEHFSPSNRLKIEISLEDFGLLVFETTESEFQATPKPKTVAPIFRLSVTQPK